jgi:peptidoglycan/LPS O-acetylase OafA/YrhL
MVQAARPEIAENDGNAALLARAGPGRIDDAAVPADAQVVAASGTAVETRARRRLGRRPALDGVRGLAVLLVVADHAHVPLGELWIGVELFFVLSGFLITSLLLEELDRTGRISMRAFYARRARRILPALALLTAAVAAVSLGAHQLQDRWPLCAQLATTWTFTANFTAWLAGAPLGAFTSTWSLSSEEQFYLLWPPVLVAAHRAGWRAPRLLAILATAIAVLIAGAWVTTGQVTSAEPYYSPVGRGAELLIGCALAVAWRSGLIPRVLAARVAGPIALAGCGGLIALGTLNIALDYEAVYISAALFGAVLLLGLLDHQDRLLHRCFAWGPLRYVGRISYGLYIYNDAASRLLHHNLPDSPWWQITPLLLAASLTAAALSYHLIEARFLRRVRISAGRLAG